MGRQGTLVVPKLEGASELPIRSLHSPGWDPEFGFLTRPRASAMLLAWGHSENQSSVRCRAQRSQTKVLGNICVGREQRKSFQKREAQEQNLEDFWGAQPHWITAPGR